MDLTMFSEEEQEYLENRVTEWKEEYYGEVYLTEFEDCTFIWRGITKSEYTQAMDFFDDEMDREDYICNKCILYPEGLDYSTDMPAGIPAILVQNILEASGYTLTKKEMDGLIAYADQVMMRYDNQIVCVIVEAFSNITVEDVESWQFKKVIDYYSKAKWILRELRGVELSEGDIDPNMVAPVPPKK